MEKVIEEMVIAGETIPLEHVDAPLELVHPDEGNPRIRYRLNYQPGGGRSLDELIMGLPEVPKLMLDIEKNRGLRERVILQPNGKGYLAREGNCRLVCYRALAKKYPDDKTWKTIPARVMPKGTDEKKVAIVMSDMHVAGKITWKAHEKAGMVHRMHKDLGMTFDDIAIYMRQSKSTAKRAYDAYAFMTERYLTIDGGVYEKDGERKWSFFDELFRSKPLRDEMKHNPEFGDQFCRWVGNGTLQHGAEVRGLPAILSNPETRRKFLGGTPLPEVERILHEEEPERGSEFFQVLARLNDLCRKAGSIGDVNLLRHNTKARQRAVDAYTAFVDFMDLADVDLPKS